MKQHTINDVGPSKTGILINGVDLRYYFDNPISFNVSKKLLLFPNKNKQSFYTAPANTIIGTVYSYITDANGNLYLMINPDYFDPSGTPFSDGSGTVFPGSHFWVDASNVSQQSTNKAKGDLSTQEQKDFANMDTMDKIGLLAKTYLPWIIGGVIVVKVIVPLATKKNN
jgi:hypothetical protein